MRGTVPFLFIISTFVIVHAAPEQRVYSSHIRGTESRNLKRKDAPVVDRISPCRHHSKGDVFSIIQSQSEGRIVNNQHHSHGNYALETAASSSYPHAVTVNSQIAVSGQNAQVYKTEIPLNQQSLPLFVPAPDFNKHLSTQAHLNQNRGNLYNNIQSNQQQSSQNNGYNYAAAYNSNRLTNGQPHAGFVNHASNGYNIYNHFNTAHNHQEASQYAGSFGHYSHGEANYQSNKQVSASSNLANNVFDGQLNQIIHETVSQTSLDPTVEKHIYVHVPPEDLEEKTHHPAQSIYTQPRKHYKIIFIKAPSYSAQNTAQLVAAAPPAEEKTLIYVLVKKPEEPSFEELEQLQATAVKHNKPEVYFIKYKTRKEGETTDSGVNAQSYDLFAQSGTYNNNDIDIRLNSGESSGIGISNSYTSSSVSTSSISGDNKNFKPHELYGIPLR